MALGRHAVFGAGRALKPAGTDDDGVGRQERVAATVKLPAGLQRLPLQVDGEVGPKALALRTTRRQRTRVDTYSSRTTKPFAEQNARRGLLSPVATLDGARSLQQIPMCRI